MAVLLRGAQLPFSTPGRAVAHISHCLLLPQATSGLQLQGKAPGSVPPPAPCAFSPPVHLLGHTETTSASPFIKLLPVAVLQWELGRVQLGPGPNAGLSLELGPAI